MSEASSAEAEDPETHPLPHPALLEMQWILQRVVAMSGAAEIYDNFDNDDDDAMALRNECDLCSREDEWDSDIFETWDEEAPAHQISPPSSPPRQPSPSPLSKRNVENPGVKMINASQGR